MHPPETEPKPAADTYILSYPKAGRTWLRALVGKALVDRYGLPAEHLLETGTLTALAGLPRVGFYHDGAAMMERLSWGELPADKSHYRSKRVLLLGRDVRDTLVSAYFQATRRIVLFEGPIGAFVRDERFGVEKVLAFYRQWEAARAVPAAFAFMRYEAMHAQPVAALRSILEFLGASDVRDRVLDDAVSFARFETLRQAEADDRFGNKMLSTASRADPESFKVRRGKVGGFRDYLADDDIAHIDACEAARGCSFTRPAREATL
ncbi:MAG: sulfotransferase domain-containing protein [Betaproteobacteria bacterium]